MSLSAFSDRTHQPTDDELAPALGRSHAAWKQLIEKVGARVAPIDLEWGYSGPSTGWGLRLRRGKRVILYMTPQQGRFLASLALGEKAVAAAHEAGLPEEILTAIDAAPKYAEGRGVRIEVTATRTIPGLVALAEIKHRN